MLNDVALPLVDMSPEQASEIVLGYDQQKFMSSRAGAATLRIVQQADYTERVTSSRSVAHFEVAA